MFEEYISHLEKMDKSPTTIRIYRYNLQSFFDYLNKKPVQFVTSDDVRDWVNSLVDNEDGKIVSIKSINDKISSLRNFYSWAEGNKKLQHNPMEEINTLKSIDDENGEIAWLAEEEFENLLNQIKMRTAQLKIEEVDRKEKYLRERTIIYLLTYAGLKLEEISKLRLTHIYMELRCIKILEKTRKCRIVPISNTLWGELQTWLEYREEMSKKNSNVKDSPYVFYGHSSPNLEFLYFQRMFINYSLPGKYLTPKILRHTFFKWMLKETNNDIETVCKWAGHNNISIMEKYLKDN